MLPPFADQSFDQVLICHTISVVNDPACLLRWASRLLKPGGRIVLLNHFQSTQPVVAWFEKVFNPLFVKIGWRSDLSLEEVLRSTTLQVEYRYKVRMLDMWQIVVLAPPQQGSPGGAPAACADADPHLIQPRRARRPWCSDLRACYELWLPKDGKFGCHTAPYSVLCARRPDTQHRVRCGVAPRADAAFI